MYYEHVKLVGVLIIFIESLLIRNSKPLVALLSLCAFLIVQQLGVE